MSSLGVVPPHQVEQWIIQSNEPSADGDHARRVATHMLQQWTATANEASTSSVPTVLFQLLQSHYPTVQFYALATLQRLVLTTTQRIQLRNHLMHEFMSSHEQHGTKPKFLRNKAASVLALYMVQDAASTEVWSNVNADMLRLARLQPALFLQAILYMLDDIAGVSAANDGSYNDTQATYATGSGPASASPLTIQQTRHFKDFLKGYHQSDHPTPGTTLLEHLFRSVIEILGASLSANGTVVLTANGGAGASNAIRESQLLALQAVTGFFQWTTASFLGHEAVNQCLEWMLYTIQLPSTVSIQLGAHHAAAVGKATLQAWYEWTTSCSSDTHHGADATHPPLASSIQSIVDPKLPVLVRLLERIHDTNLLPEASASSAHLVEVSDTKLPSPSDLVDAEGMEVIIQLAIVVNSIALELLPLYEQQVLAVQPVENRNRSMETLFHQSLDLFFRAFAYDDIDVSTAVLPFATRLSFYLEEDGATKATSATAGSLRQHLPLVLVTLYHQMKYPVDFEFDYEDEGDAEEVMFRTELCKVFNKLVRAAPETCLQFITEAAAMHVSTNSAAAAPAPHIEAILRLIYHYSEALQPPPGLKTAMQNETFCSLLEALHTSNIAQHPHREVVCLYYETAIRYYPLFLQKGRTALLASLLGSMSGVTGLQHEHSRVRSRCCYLLLRLTKSTIAMLRPFVETAVTGIQGLLSNANLALRSDDSLYLFETIGLLLGKTGLDSTDQKRYLTAVMSPHVQSIEAILRSLPGLQLGAENQIEVLSGSIAAITHLSKGFHKPDEGVCSVLIEALRATLAVLEVLSSSESIRNKSMVLLQRMILCAGKDVLPMIPNFLRLLITDCTSDDILFVSQIFNQLCIKFNAEAIPAMDASLLPFLQKCQSLVLTHDTESVDVNESCTINLVPPHVHTEQVSVQKLAYVVLQHIVTHKVTSLLISDINARHFETVLAMVCDGAIRVPDPVVRKTCIRFFRELLEQFAEAAIDDAYRRGLFVFVCQSLVPGVLYSMITSPLFNVKDANQASVLAEFARLLSAVQALCRENDELYNQFVTTLSSVVACDGTAPLTADREAFRRVSNTEGMQAYLLELLQRSQTRGTSQVPSPTRQPLGR